MRRVIYLLNRCKFARIATGSASGCEASTLSPAAVLLALILLGPSAIPLARVESS